MSSRPLVRSAVPGEEPNIQNVLAHHPDLQERFNHIYGLIWSHGRVDLRTKELSRMRNARVTGCGFCVNVRFDPSLPESQIACVIDGYEDSAFSDREVAALHLTDALVGVPRPLRPEMWEELLKHFDVAEITELATCISIGIATEKVLIGLGLEPEPGSMPLTVLPVPDTAV